MPEHGIHKYLLQMLDLLFLAGTFILFRVAHIASAEIGLLMLSLFCVLMGVVTFLVSIAAFSLSFHQWMTSVAHRSLRHGDRVLVYSRTGFGLAAACVLAGVVLGSELALVVGVLLLIATLVYNLICLQLRRIPVSAAPTPTTVLVVAAHPDDLEIACGATIAKLVDTGHRVFGMIMTNGSQGGNAAVRPDEARKGATFLGITDLRILDLPDRCLSDHSQEMVETIEEALSEVGADLILTHSQHDVHQDHAAVHAAVLRAARNHHSILCFESPSVTKEFSPSIYIDVSDYHGVKMSAINAHADQLDKPYMTRDIVSGITVFRGRQARLERAEAFEVVRLRLYQSIPF